MAPLVDGFKIVLCFFLLFGRSDEDVCAGGLSISREGGGRIVHQREKKERKEKKKKKMPKVRKAGADAGR